jgi:hypothetical protein
MENPHPQPIYTSSLTSPGQAAVGPSLLPLFLASALPIRIRSPLSLRNRRVLAIFSLLKLMEALFRKKQLGAHQ